MHMALDCKWLARSFDDAHGVTSCIRESCGVKARSRVYM